LHLFPLRLEGGKVVVNGENIEYRLGLNARDGCAADVVQLDGEGRETIRNDFGDNVKASRPSVIMVGQHDGAAALHAKVVCFKVDIHLLPKTYSVAVWPFRPFSTGPTA